jgi:hypothetical protein
MAIAGQILFDTVFLCFISLNVFFFPYLSTPSFPFSFPLHLYICYQNAISNVPSVCKEKRSRLHYGSAH